MKRKSISTVFVMTVTLFITFEAATAQVNYMNQIPLARDLLSFASPVIASSLLLDHYVPDMHRESLLGPAGILL